MFFSFLLFSYSNFINVFIISCKYLSTINSLVFCEIQYYGIGLITLLLGIIPTSVFKINKQQL